MWSTLIAPILGLAGLVWIFVLGLINVDALIGAGPTVSLLLTVSLPVVFVVGLLYARYLKTSKPDVYAAIGRQ